MDDAVEIVKDLDIDPDGDRPDFQLKRPVQLLGNTEVVEANGLLSDQVLESDEDVTEVVLELEEMNAVVKRERRRRLPLLQRLLSVKPIIKPTASCYCYCGVDYWLRYCLCCRWS